MRNGLKIKSTDLSPTLIRESWDNIRVIAEDQSDEYWDMGNFLIELPGKWQLSFLVRHEVEIVGYAILSIKSDANAHLHHFMVKPRHRNTGVGSQMMAEVERRCKKIGINVLSLKVHRANAVAKAFYIKKGFHLQTDRNEYQFMIKNLQTISVGIHQPNYMPWFGYFKKIARSDVFVFLDDVQFSKGGYTNRVKILSAAGPVWFTLPVKVSLGKHIDQIAVANSKWVRSHLDVLRNCYQNAPQFSAVWPEIEALYTSSPRQMLSAINIHFITALAERLNLGGNFRVSSELDITLRSDDRLIALTRALAPQGTYISGQGAAKYQDPQKFHRAGLGFEYLHFSHPDYDQNGPDFQAGLSVLDAIFHVGFSQTAELIRAR